MTDTKSKSLSAIHNTLPTPIGIVGLGISGHATKELLLFLGYKNSELLTFDSKPQKAQYSDIDDFLLQKPRTLIISPGIPLNQAWVQQVRSAGVFITSELGFASQFLTTEKTIGITGSVGKSTTTSLIGVAAAANSSNIFVGGNLGIPLAQYILDVKKRKRTRAKWVILELSSYQLENVNPLKLNHSIITHLGPNHLERYNSIFDYYETKWSILSRTKGTLYLNRRGGELLSFATNHMPKSKARSSHIKWVDQKDEHFKDLNWNRISLLGEHNRDNVALALRLAIDLDWGSSSIDAIMAFKGLEHRLENLGEVQGIHYINDSKATAIDSVLASVSSLLTSVPEDKRLILLLGGRDKNLPWDNLTKLMDQKKLRFFFFGECARLAQGKSHLPGKSFLKLEDALKYVKEYAKIGDWVLLSPGGSSLDEFSNFEARGTFFKNYFQTQNPVKK